MKLYSDFPARRAWQIVGDVVTIGSIAFVVWIASLVHGAVMVLAEFGRAIEGAGVGFQEAMRELGERLGAVPIIGGGIRVPFDGASGAGGLLADAGRAEQDLIATLALFAAIGVAAIPVAGILLVWLLLRARFVRRASEAARMSRLPDGPDVLALRALIRADARTLRSIAEEPVDAWRRGDPAVVRALARLELEGAGVRLR